MPHRTDLPLGRRHMSRPRWSGLARELTALTPQQPATVAWRVVELDHLLSRDLPEGLGLDVGCGDGSISAVVRAHGARWRLVGIDRDPGETALAERSMQYERVHTGSADAVPEPDRTFDFAFSNSVLEHIPELPAVLRETARTLKPGGTLVATVPSANLHACLRGPGVLAPLLGRTRTEYLERIDSRTAHVNLWSAAQWAEQLALAGFSEVVLTPYMSCEDVRRWERLSNWSGGLVHALAGGAQHPLTLTRDIGIATGSVGSRALTAPAAVVVLATLRGSQFLAGSPARPDDAGFGCLLVEARRGNG